MVVEAPVDGAGVGEGVGRRRIKKEASFVVRDRSMMVLTKCFVMDDRVVDGTSWLSLLLQLEPWFEGEEIRGFM